MTLEILLHSIEQHIQTPNQATLNEVICNYSVYLTEQCPMLHHDTLMKISDIEAKALTQNIADCRDEPKYDELLPLLVQRSIVRAKMWDSQFHAINISGATQIMESVKAIDRRGKTVCYLDQNSFTPFLHGESDITLPENALVIYSPAHIEEISASPKEFHRGELDLVSKKCRDMEIAFVDDVAHVILEHPSFPYNRISDDNDRELAQELKVLVDSIQELRWGSYRTDKKRNIYNSQHPEAFLRNHTDIVDELLAKLKKKYRVKDILASPDSQCWSILNPRIHDLYDIMDICGFQKDNNERRMRSSRLDIEHLLYASVCDVFYTKDKKLRYRAKNIFDMLGKNVECPDC